MAPTKFGIFKGRSRENPEPPSTENLLQNSSTEQMNSLESPIPSTSKGIVSHDMSPLDILSVLNIDDDDDEIIGDDPPSRRASLSSKIEEQQILYENLQNESTGTSTMTLEDLDEIQIYDEPDKTLTSYDDSTSYDANSLQFDETSIATSEDISMYCAMLKKPKKSRSKEQQLTDFDMWQASDVQVMKNLLSRSGTLDEQIKWEAIATSRGLCTLTDSCTCDDCTGGEVPRWDRGGRRGSWGCAPL